MKSFNIVLILLFISTALFAQDEKKREIEFKVYGKCDMCKTRIEKALLIKGVKFSSWDIESQMLKVVYDPRKTDEDKIHQAIADVGHDTDKIRAEDKVYDKIHHCCKYLRPEVVE